MMSGTLAENDTKRVAQWQRTEHMKTLGQVPARKATNLRQHLLSTPSQIACGVADAAPFRKLVA